MKDMKRALRRRELARMKKRARRLFSRYGYDTPAHEKLANHMAYCSRPCCGNGRKWFGHKTLDEVKFYAQPLDLE